MLKVYNNFNPVVSVVMAVYNREDYIRRSINSLLEQTYCNWELIAVDDGSNDNSFAILEEYGLHYENIRIIQQKNRKLPLTRNTGILASAGKYITFLDSDDEYHPQHLEMRINYMKTYPEVDLIHGGVQIIGNPFVIDKDNKRKKIHLSRCTIGGTFFGKREVFFNLNGFNNISYSEDSEFILRAEKLFRVKKVTFETYIYHRETPGSITNQYASTQI